MVVQLLRCDGNGLVGVGPALKDRTTGFELREGQDSSHRVDRHARRARAGIRRTLGHGAADKNGDRTKFLRQLVLDLPDTAEGMRDRALLLVGFAWLRNLSK